MREKIEDAARLASAGCVRLEDASRLARWLLMARDRVHCSELFLTHDALALMLGVRRESVTQAASAMQRSGLISYSRGYVMLLDVAATAALVAEVRASVVRATSAALDALATAEAFGWEYHRATTLLALADTRARAGR